MTPDQQFARLIKFSMLLFVAILAYFMLADLKMPLTTQAMATRTVVKMAPQVSGRVTNVLVHNNQHVKQGDILFTLDDSPYKLALEKAKLSLDEAMQNNAELDASIRAASAEIHANEAQLEQKRRDAKRLSALYASNGVSRQLRDQAATDVRTTEAALTASKAQLAKLIAARGNTGSSNLKLLQAHNQEQQAELNLSYTKVCAQEDGVVTNLQLMDGSIAANDQPVLAIVSDKLDIIADFREKSLRGVNSQTQAWVTFDADPGKLFLAQVTSRDAGVSTGQFDANGSLATPIKSDRWIRDAQRMRLHLSLQTKDFPLLATGSLATVQLIPKNSLYRFLAKLQIKGISLLHYIY
ncbi:HlyD family secretion protein [Hydrogenovibrio marinus]|uniref:Hemolysin D n=1 Tax=Hydrogenovibrio marinus TaxID=28885 RepID=A0A066ZXR4_HYDMR|nr:HlyD family secretion protein [Hydrogenovibrio marinus]KDN95131.1 hemolysin D [Hydrogenovibrio marinus]BBN59604.1 hemolysin D [Hydrogenovibrio marinus]